MLSKTGLPIGFQAGSLTVIGPAFRVRAGKAAVWSKARAYCVCVCDCGNHTVCSISDLKQVGKLKSCGCWRIKVGKSLGKSNQTHGESKTSLWTLWHNLRDRCNNPNCDSYPDYGGRGIEVCNEWDDDYTSFSTWAKVNGYKPGLQIDRRNNAKGYSPNNCRFVPCKTNQRNRRDNVLLTIDGVTKCVTEWVEVSGVHKDTIYRRLKSGWQPKAAVFTPPLGRGNLRRNTPEHVKNGSLIPPKFR